MSTATIPPAAPALISAEEFLKLHGDVSGIELVKGRIVRLPMPGLHHGRVCFKAAFLIGDFVMHRDLGQIMTNDSFVHAGSNPDSVRGADVCYFSYARLPKDEPCPTGAAEVSPNLVVEVRSPSDRSREVQEKVDEYLEAGVDVVLVLDPSLESATVFRKTSEDRLSSRDELTLPDVLPGFGILVRKFFE